MFAIHPLDVLTRGIASSCSRAPLCHIKDGAIGPLQGICYNLPNVMTHASLKTYVIRVMIWEIVGVSIL